MNEMFDTKWKNSQIDAKKKMSEFNTRRNDNEAKMKKIMRVKYKGKQTRKEKSQF